MFVPRLVNALASWSQAVSIAEAGRRKAMAKHIEENLGYEEETQKKKKHQELLRASHAESFFEEFD